MPGVIDRPKLVEETDFLGIEQHANALIEFINSTVRYTRSSLEDPVKLTGTPIAIGIQGERGTGKASLMNTICH